MPARRPRPGLGPLALAIGLVVSACASEPAVTATSPPLVVPADWVISTSLSRDLRLALPPWLVASNTTGAIFAHEVVAPGGQGLQLLAEGPRSEVQPGLGEDLRAWLARRLADPGSGAPVFQDVLLPAGSAVMMERIDRVGTATAWRHRAWAIRMRAGVAFLWIDGPPGAWSAREDDLARIPMFLAPAE
jgi:hypothetical protein